MTEGLKDLPTGKQVDGHLWFFPAAAGVSQIKFFQGVDVKGENNTSNIVTFCSVIL